MNNKLWTRDFTIITIGSAVSILGNSMAGFASSLLVLDYTGSTFLFALFNVVFMIPYLVVPLIAGPLLDRFSRKRAIYTLDFVSAGMYLLIFFLLKLGFFSFVPLLLFTFVEGCISSVYSVAYESFYPNLVSEGNLSRAYSIDSLLWPLSALMTPVAAFIYERVGVEPLFLANCVCFFIAACFEVSIRAEEKHIASGGEKPSVSRFVSDFRDGWGYLKSEPGLMCIALYFCASNFVGGIDTLVLPYFRSVPALGVTLYTYVMAFSVAGRFIGGLVHYKFKYPTDKKFAIALFVYAVLNVLYAGYLFLPVPLMMLFLFATGFLGVTSYNIRISATQSYIPDSHRARFNGIFSVITTVGTVSGELAAGALAEAFPIRAVVVGLCVLGLVSTLIMVFGRRSVKLIYNRQV